MIDAHVHFWDPERLPVDWISGDAILDRRLGPADYTVDALDVDAVVAVEGNVAVGRAVDEAAWLAGLGGRPRIAAIVAWSPLDGSAPLGPHLDLLAANPLVRGVRRNIQGERDPGFCLDPGWLDRLRMVGARGMTFDVCVTHDQLASVAEMVRRCPGTQFVLDHLGKPAVLSGRLDPWRTDLRALAALPNVVCKVSGLATEADPASWRAADLEPYVAHALDVFGEDRVLFGSDWPVVRLAGGWRRWADALAGLGGRLGGRARQALGRERGARVPDRVMSVIAEVVARDVRFPAAPAATTPRRRTCTRTRSCRASKSRFCA